MVIFLLMVSYDLVVQMTAGDAFLIKIHWQNRIIALNKLVIEQGFKTERVLRLT
jgi:hypothetical protein